jgi:hypothetical protein
LQALEDFCFPNGIDSDLVPHVKIPDKMNNLDPSSQVIPHGKLHDTPTPRASIKKLHLKNQQNSFVFMLTSETKETCYGICVIDDILKVRCILLFLLQIRSSRMKSLVVLNKQHIELFDDL